MTAHARNKGKRGEREVVALLQGILQANKLTDHFSAENIGRNLSQTRGGGFDIENVPLLAVEVKYQETPNFKSYWNQAYKQALQHCEAFPDDPLTPVVFWRKARAKWKVLIPAAFLEGCESIPEYIEMDTKTFTYWWVSRLRKHIPTQK